MGSPAEIDDIRAQRRERDMILAPNEYAFVTDETKGEVNVYVGPNKQSLAGTDRPVTFSSRTKRFEACDLKSATQTFQTAPEGWYVVLKNPAENEKVPAGMGKLSTPVLKIGKKVNISGPTSFALWPGQMAKVVQGHNLRSNEYLLVRVYDEEAAKQNWQKSVIKTQGDDATPQLASDPQKQASSSSPRDIISVADLTMGKLFVIKGTEVSFYIPSSGIEVVPEKVNGEERYVREAVTLERLEYCLLLDQNGSKRYVHGPDVVFPRPTEKFVSAPIKSNPDKAQAKKFRAQELTPKSGIHIRVIADYTEADGTKRKAGEELFITGTVQSIYFPREEHAIVKYGEQDVHYGIAIPAGEARYVLDRDSGEITTVKGPQVFLPDPRKQVIAQRALDLKTCSLLYPGNADALEINKQRLGIDDQDIMGAGGGNAAFLNNSYVRGTEDENYAAVAGVVNERSRGRVMIKNASNALPGDAFDRKSKFTAPRSVVLNTKYDGAVTTTIWTGYAMLLIRKSGERRVVQGPGTFMLEYDESPQVITLSAGKPKTTDSMVQTVFLQTKANKVSDIVDVETKDFCKLSVKLSYRVNFEGEDPEMWFNVDNYVKFLCDHARSRIRSAVQKITVEEFYSNHTDILRNIVLGLSTSDGEGADASRPGMAFKENNMLVYDVEVLGLQLQNADVEKLLVGAQREVIQNTLLLAGDRRRLDYVTETEDLKRRMEEARALTTKANLEMQAETAKLQLELDLTKLEARARVIAESATNDLANERAMAERRAVQLQTSAAEHEQELEQKRAEQALELEKIDKQVQAVVEKAKAISPDLCAALSAFGERAMVEKVAEAMAPLGIISGGKKSVLEILQELLKGTALANQLGTVMDKPNGATKSTRATA